MRSNSASGLRDVRFPQSSMSDGTVPIKEKPASITIKFPVLGSISVRRRSANGASVTATPAQIFLRTESSPRRRPSSTCLGSRISPLPLPGSGARHVGSPRRPSGMIPPCAALRAQWVRVLLRQIDGRAFGLPASGLCDVRSRKSLWSAAGHVARPLPRRRRDRGRLAPRWSNTSTSRDEVSTWEPRPQWPGYFVVSLM